ncbi:hypothetical protein V1512DRAFT_259546 [Lipomyces arxii]|uniref:uncharacterized protein n=1 Tax=Lipomyces arxii TaxID=56418 RepID=UPI0034CE400C
MSSQLASFAREEANLLMLPPPPDASPDDFRNPRLMRQRMSEYLEKLPVRQKVFGGAVMVFLGVATILLLVFHSQIFGFIQPMCESWSTMRGGSLLLILLISVTSFPPIIGYTSVVTIAGLVYGVWKGWAIASFATVFASYGCFVACRMYFFDFAQRLAEHNRNFEALAFTLEHDGLKLLWMIRMSPLPFSFSNAALSTIHTISPRNFAIATLISTPKLLIPVFIGSRLRNLSDDKLDTGTKVLNLFSIIGGAAVAALTGWIIYQRMTQRSRHLYAQVDHERQMYDEPLRTPASNEDARDIDLSRLGGANYRDDPELHGYESEDDGADYGEPLTTTSTNVNLSHTPSLLDDADSDEEANLIHIDDRSNDLSK